MRLGLDQIFPQGNEPLYWRGGGIELAIIPDMNTAQVTCGGVKTEAPLSAFQLQFGDITRLIYTLYGTGFELELPPELSMLLTVLKNRATR